MLFSFITQFYKNILFKCLLALISLPAFFEDTIVMSAESYFPKYEDRIHDIVSETAIVLKWGAILLIIFFHIQALYSLWEKKVKKEEKGVDVGPSEGYENVLRGVEVLIPEEAQKLRNIFSKAQKKMIDPDRNHDMRVSIQSHYKAYKIIMDFLEQHFRSGGPNVEMTKQISELRSKFRDNYNELENHEYVVGKNEYLEIDENDLKKLIDNINENLSSLFQRMKV